MIIALVLLFFAGILSAESLKQIVAERRESKKNLVRTQGGLFLVDALKRTEARRVAEPDFSGETLAIRSEQGSFSGVFQLTTRFNAEKNEFDSEMKYVEEK